MRRERGASNRGEFRPEFHPAGLDKELRVALEELRVGRWVPVRDLLARTGARCGLRTSRSQVLAAAAARSHAIREWLEEEPNSADGLMMRARVSTERALHAHRKGHHSAPALAVQAREAAVVAARAASADPVPWVCRLALAQMDTRQEAAEHRIRPPEVLLPTAPWGLLNEVYKRDKYNREAYHRVLRFLLCVQGGSPAAGLHFTHWVGSWVPEESASALLVLPLYAYAEHYRDKRKRGRYDAIGRMQWTREPLSLDVGRALRSWFEHAPLVEMSVLDLNHLAHALWADQKYDQAARVFDVVGTNATGQPWAYVASDPGAAEAEFLRARAQCLALRQGTAAPRAGPE